MDIISVALDIAYTLCVEGGREREGTHAQLAKDVVVSLGRVRIPTHGTLNDAETQRPDIALHAICPTAWVCTCLGNAATGDSLGRHVRLAADIGLCDTSDQIPADAEIANLDLASAIH